MFLTLLLLLSQLQVRVFDTDIQTNTEYYYRIKGKNIDMEVESAVIGPAKAKAQIFNMGRLNIAICVIILFVAND